MRNTLHPLEYATGRNTNEISLSQGLARIRRLLDRINKAMQVNRSIERRHGTLA